MAGKEDTYAGRRAYAADRQDNTRGDEYTRDQAGDRHREEQIRQLNSSRGHGARNRDDQPQHESRPEAFEHKQLYQFVHDQSDGSQVDEVGKTAMKIGNFLMDATQRFNDAQTSAAEAWQGDAAESAGRHSHGSSKWLDGNAQAIQMMSTQYALQADAVDTAKHEMPEPDDFDPEKAMEEAREKFKGDDADSAEAMEARDDITAKSEAAEEKKKQAEAAVLKMEKSFDTAMKAQPEFQRPDDLSGEGSETSRSNAGPGGEKVDDLNLSKGTGGTSASSAAPAAAPPSSVPSLGGSGGPVAGGAVSGGAPPAGAAGQFGGGAGVRAPAPSGSPSAIPPAAAAGAGTRAGGRAASGRFNPSPFRPSTSAVPRAGASGAGFAGARSGVGGRGVGASGAGASGARGGFAARGTGAPIQPGAGKGLAGARLTAPDAPKSGQGSAAGRVGGGAGAGSGAGAPKAAGPTNGGAQGAAQKAGAPMPQSRPGGAGGAMGPAAGAGAGGRGKKGEDDQGHQNDYAVAERLDDGLGDGSGKTIDPETGMTVVRPVIGEADPNKQ